MPGRIAYQGEPGAYSHQACAETFPEMEAVACPSFEAAIAEVREGRAELAMLPVENTTYGRVADIHRLLPESGLQIIGEAFVRVHINLLGIRGARIEDIKVAASHLVLLPQCAGYLARHGIRGVIASDNARAAREVAEAGDPTRAALASEMAAEVYGLEILAAHIEDQGHNTTRFLVMSREGDRARRGEHGMLTTFVFRVRNIPAALYKALGGFATNGVNMTKLESYMVDGSFSATQFYADVEGHPDDEGMRHAFEELDYFTSELHILGTYPRDPRRP